MDPLKPFSASIRLLWERTVQRNGSPATGSADRRASTSPQAPNAVAPPRSIQSRLQSRLALLTTWNAKRARALFVESVVLEELGDELSADPAFDSLVQRVSEQLAADESLSARLDQLLQTTRAGARL